MPVTSSLPRPVLALAALLAFSLAGCASQPPFGSSPEQELDRGLEALRARDYRTARGILHPLAAAHPGTPAGDQAGLILAAVALDPRNPDRRLDLAARRTAALLRSADSTATRPIAETLYLLALDLGARAPTGGEPGTLPTLPDTTIAVRLRVAVEERDSLRLRVATLEADATKLNAGLRQKDQELTRLTQELDRIRKTLRH